MDYQKSLFTADGIEVRLVEPVVDNRSRHGRKLYVSRDGKGYALSERRLAPEKSYVANSKSHLSSGNSRWGWHEIFVHFKMYVHRAVWIAWNTLGLSKIPKGYEIHHLNGIESDNCFDNLVCLSCSEHKIWDHRMYILRDKLGNLKAVPYDRLRELQAMPTVELQYHLDHLQHVDPEDQMNYEITHHVEFLEH